MCANSESFPPGVAYGVSTLSDGLQKVEVPNRVLDHGIRSVVPFTRMAGTAVTVKLIPAAKDAMFGLGPL